MYQLIGQENKLRRINQEVSPLATKNTGLVSELCCILKWVPTAIYSGIDILVSPWVLFLTINEFSTRITKITSMCLFLIFSSVSIIHLSDFADFSTKSKDY